ncbi:MAG: DEAD/DEAH box helicase [Sphaerochaetaceae bacterium]
MRLSLYPWQRACMESWLSNEGHGIVQVVTGAGKTFMALSCAHHLDGLYHGRLKVRILVPKTFMVAQWKSFILDQQEQLGIRREDIGIWHGQHKDPPDRKVMLYVINSARMVFSRHMLAELDQGTPMMLIADECHHYASAENRKIFEFLPLVPDAMRTRLHTLGLSATPQAEGFDEILVPSLGPLIYSYGFSEAMAQQVINNCTLYNVSLDMATKEREKYDKLSQGISSILKKLELGPLVDAKGVSEQFFIRIRKLTGDADPMTAEMARNLLVLLFKRKALVHEASVRIDCAFHIIERLDPQSRIIVFSERIRQTDALYDMLSIRWPGQVARYHSHMGDMAKIRSLARYREQEVRILVCCRALDEGFDIPAADVGIVLSGTSTKRQRIQRLGRILRRAEGKLVSNLFYLYLHDTMEDHALFTEGTEEIQEFDLRFLGPAEGFLHPVYDRLANQVVQQEIAQGTDARTVAWYEHFLLQGQLRSDWLMDEQSLSAFMGNATSLAERNYWMCMVRMVHTMHVATSGFVHQN